MNKKIRTLFISVIVILLLGLALYLLSQSGNEPDGSRGKVSPELEIINVEAADVETITVKNEKDEFTLKWYDVKESNKTARKMRIEGFEKVPAVQTTYDSLQNNSCYLTALRLYSENTGDMSSFGFQNPSATLKVTLKDKGMKTAIFGSAVPDNSGCYATLVGENKVYIVKTAIVDLFKFSRDNYISKNMIRNYSDSEVLNVGQIELGGTCRAEKIVIQRNQDENSAQIFLLKEPVESFSNNEKVAEICQILKLFLSGDEIVKIHPSAGELKEYGFDNPYSTIKFIFDDHEVLLTIGAKADANQTLYCMVDDIPVIYSVSASLLSYYDYDLDDLRSNALFSALISSIKEMNVTYDGNVYKIALTQKKNNETTAEVNGRKVEFENISTYYSTFLLTTREKDSAFLKAGEPVYKITFKFNYGREDSTVEYYKDGENYHCFIDGVNKGIVNSYMVNKLIQDTKPLAEGKTLEK